MSITRNIPAIPDFLTEIVTDSQWAVFVSFSQAVMLFFVLLISCFVLLFLERKLIARLQQKYDANRVGVFGVGHFVADMIKLTFKQSKSQKAINQTRLSKNLVSKNLVLKNTEAVNGRFKNKQSKNHLIPAVSIFLAFLSFTIIPFTPSLGVLDWNIGGLLFFGLVSISIYTYLLASWSSQNRRSISGSIYLIVHTLGYQMVLLFSMLGIVAMSNSANLRQIVALQFNGWNILYQPLAFIAFLVAGLALVQFKPFNYKAEEQLYEAYNVAYLGRKAVFFDFAKYINLIVFTALMVCLFFGGWFPPFHVENSQFFSAYGLWFFLKMVVLLTFFMVIKVSIMSLKFRQAMIFAWVILLPITMLNYLSTSLMIVSN